jgi:hypothetical protein
MPFRHLNSQHRSLFLHYIMEQGSKKKMENITLLYHIDLSYE